MIFTLTMTEPNKFVLYKTKRGVLLTRYKILLKYYREIKHLSFNSARLRIHHLASREEQDIVIQETIRHFNLQPVNHKVI